MTCLAMLQHYYVPVINTQQLVGMVKLVTNISKGKERFQVKNTVGGTHDNLDTIDG